MEQVFVGIDVSKDQLDVHAHPSGEPLRSRVTARSGRTDRSVAGVGAGAGGGGGDRRLRDDRGGCDRRLRSSGGVALTGAGSTFSAGVDTKAFVAYDQDERPRMVLAITRMTASILSLPCPLVR